MTERYYKFQTISAAKYRAKQKFGDGEYTHESLGGYGERQRIKGKWVDTEIGERIVVRKNWERVLWARIVSKQAKNTKKR